MHIISGNLPIVSAVTVHGDRETLIREIDQFIELEGTTPGEPYLKVTCANLRPEEHYLVFETKEKIPDEDVPCVCGNPFHFAIKYERGEGVRWARRRVSHQTSGELPADPMSGESENLTQADLEKLSQRVLDAARAWGRVDHVEAEFMSTRIVCSPEAGYRDAVYISISPRGSGTGRPKKPEGQTTCSRCGSTVSVFLPTVTQCSNCPRDGRGPVLGASDQFVVMSS